MQKLFWLVALIVFSLPMMALTIYDLQYNPVAPYDSPYIGQTVTVQGIVTEVGYGVTSTSLSPKYFISDPEGGPWSGIYVYDFNHTPTVGDLVEITGNVSEYYNFTELSVSSYTRISQNNPVPPAVLITTNTLSNAETAEPYESVFCSVEDVTVATAPDSHNEFYVTDGSGNCQIDDGCFGVGYTWQGITLNQHWAEIKGIVDYSFSLFGINPRTTADMIQVQSLANAIVRIQTVTTHLNQITPLNVITSKLFTEWNVSRYDLRVGFDPALAHFEGVDTTGTLTPAGIMNITYSVDSDTVYISWEGDSIISTELNDQVLLKLLFSPTTYGEATINLDAFHYNSTNITGLTDGKLVIPISKSIAYLSIGNPPDGKNIFNPWLNQKIEIKYGCKVVNGSVNGKAVVRIYDVQGRLVATPVNKNISTSTGVESYMWDGRDSSRILLPIGMYYCHLEVMDRGTGQKETTVQPIVIAAELK